METPPPPPQDNYALEAPPAAPKKSKLGWIIGGIFALGFCVCIPILAAVLFPVFAQAKLAAQKTQALKSLQTSAVSVLIYAADYDDHFPPNMGDSQVLFDALAAYQTDNGANWTIQDTPTEGNPNLSGVNIVEIPNIQSTIMLYCMPPKLNNLAVVASADSATRAVKASDLELEITANTFKMPPKN